MALRLRDRFPDVRCWAFCPPGGLVDARLSRAVEPFVTSVVVGKDAVSRMSVGPATECTRIRLPSGLHPTYYITLHYILHYPVASIQHIAGTESGFVAPSNDALRDPWSKSGWHAAELRHRQGAHPVRQLLGSRAFLGVDHRVCSSCLVSDQEPRLWWLLDHADALA
jgi:hypothetical protein